MSQCKVIVAQLDDPTIFPQQYGVHFPPNFVDVVKVIFKRLFRVYAHIYHSHFKNVCSLGEEAHLNTCFKHFMAFAQVRLFRVGGRRLQRQLCRHQCCRVNTRADCRRCTFQGANRHLAPTSGALLLVQVFELIEQRELAPLQQLIDQMVR